MKLLKPRALYGSATQLLITNWLPFDLTLKFRVLEPQEWHSALRPDRTCSTYLPAYSSIHQPQMIKPQ